LGKVDKILLGFRHEFQFKLVNLAENCKNPAENQLNFNKSKKHEIFNSIKHFFYLKCQLSQRKSNIQINTTMISTNTDTWS